MAQNFGGIISLKDNFSSTIGKYKSGIKGAEGATTKATKASGGLSSGLKTLGLGFGAVSMIKGSIDAYAGFEDQLLRVKALTGATESEYSKLTDTAKKLGSSTRYSAKEVGKAQEYFAMA